ncbi:hypothetical protein [Ancylobacter sp.]|uniref:hypothetical protein n=1 Tax=Ancylobacter sp. TaxID=1872567 RepID=UPI003D118CFF
MSTAKRNTTKRASVPAATPAPGVVDLSAIEASIKRQDEGIVVDIMGPDGKTPLGLKIRVAGPDSARAREGLEALIDELTAEGGAGNATKAERYDHGLRYLAKTSMSWEGQVKFDGKVHDFSEAAALALYRRFGFISPQVDKAVDRSRFMNG